MNVSIIMIIIFSSCSILVIMSCEGKLVIRKSKTVWYLQKTNKKSYCSSLLISHLLFEVSSVLESGVLTIWNFRTFIVALSGFECDWTPVWSFTQNIRRTIIKLSQRIINYWINTINIIITKILMNLSTISTHFVIDY